MNKYFNNDKKLKMYLLCFMLAIMISFVIVTKMSILKILFIGVCILCLLLLGYKLGFDDAFIASFFLAIPFLTEFKVTKQPDYHMVTSQYYSFGFLQLFTVVMLYISIKNIKKIKWGIDLTLLLAFTIFHYFSSIYAINTMAAIYESFRWTQLFIVYLYFSRVFEYSKYKQMIYNCATIGLIFQLFLGLAQIIKGGPVGFKLLGEGNSVFRGAPGSYESGISGTLHHPGPLGIYACIMLTWLLFSKGKEKAVRYIGIIIATIIIILSAGRTSIVLAIFIYGIKMFQNRRNIMSKVKINVKSIIVMALVAVMVASGTFIFRGQIKTVVDRFVQSDAKKQVSNRLEHVEIAMHYIKQKPILGWGSNNYLDLTRRDFSEEEITWNFFLRNPIHNAYLLFAVEEGIIASIVFVMFLLLSLGRYPYNRWKGNIGNNIELNGYCLVIIIYGIYNLQGWGGVQTRTVILFLLSAAFIKNSLDNIDSGRVEYKIGE